MSCRSSFFGTARWFPNCLVWIPHIPQAPCTKTYFLCPRWEGLEMNQVEAAHRKVEANLATFEKKDELYSPVSHIHRYRDCTAFRMDIPQLSPHITLQGESCTCYRIRIVQSLSSRNGRSRTSDLDIRYCKRSVRIWDAVQASALRLLQDHLPGVSYPAPELHTTRSRAYPVRSCFLYSD